MLTVDLVHKIGLQNLVSHRISVIRNRFERLLFQVVKA